MLRCRALELTVEQCISAALSQDEVSALQQLLATFLPAAGDHAALAAAIARLSGLLAQDTGSVDTAGAATRALTCVISTLKDAKEDAAAAVGAARPTTLQVRVFVCAAGAAALPSCSTPPHATALPPPCAHIHPLHMHHPPTDTHTHT
jgi:hypothetical protein